MGLAPWTKDEKWEFGTYPDGRRWATVFGRERCPTKYKFNPLWAFRNDYEQQLAEAPWFEPDKPFADRKRDWALRNPFQNANLFVWGVADRNYTVTVLEGAPDPMVIQRDDLQPPQQGWQRALLTLDDGTTKKWNCYVGKRITVSWGHQPSGLFELKLNFHKGA